MRLVKGHGTGNDFLLLPDLDGALGDLLTPDLVVALCDRHTGVGADGVLRVVRSDDDPDGRQIVAGDARGAPFFMDYRNADGTVAEMCGNGVRVFHEYLLRAGLVGPDAAVATRGGIRRVRARGDGTCSVAMGAPRLLADRPIATAASRPGAPTLAPTAGTAVEMPNPHVVVPVADPAVLAGLDLRLPPQVDPPLPHGQNVEFVVPLGPRHLQLRVHERGSGETRSCGTGICAAAVAAATAAGVGADGSRWRVDVPGGTCTVVWTADGVELTGPAVLVGSVEIDDAWLARFRSAAPATTAPVAAG